MAEKYRNCTKDDLFTNDRSVRLFNVVVDPTEYFDVADVYPSLVEAMLDRLATYNATAVPCYYPPNDPQCNPKLHSGAWGPWE